MKFLSGRELFLEREQGSGYLMSGVLPSLNPQLLIANAPLCRVEPASPPVAKLESAPLLGVSVIFGSLACFFGEILKVK